MKGGANWAQIRCPTHPTHFKGRSRFSLIHKTIVETGRRQSHQSHCDGSHIPKTIHLNVLSTLCVPCWKLHRMFWLKVSLLDTSIPQNLWDSRRVQKQNVGHWIFNCCLVSFTFYTSGRSALTPASCPREGKCTELGEALQTG